MTPSRQTALLRVASYERTFLRPIRVSELVAATSEPYQTWATRMRSLVEDGLIRGRHVAGSMNTNEYRLTPNGWSALEAMGVQIREARAA